MQQDGTTRQIIGEVDNPAQTVVKMDVPQFVIIMGAAAIGAVVGAVLGAPGSPLGALIGAAVGALVAAFVATLALGMVKILRVVVGAWGPVEIEYA